MIKKLISFGHGYSAQALEDLLLPNDWKISATTRKLEKAKEMKIRNLSAFIWPGEDLLSEINSATHILLSIAPNVDGDPVFLKYSDAIRNSKNLKWVGYLSTTGVYGDRQGELVNETSKVSPTTERGKYRVLAENQWLSLVEDSDIPVHIFRLAGIYGLGRGPFSKVLAGTAKKIIKPGQVFSRIHVKDIARVLSASINKPNAGAIYNVCDDLSAPPEDVLSYAAKLLNVKEPPKVDFFSSELPEMVRSFYSECKRVDNSRIKTELVTTLSYPNYKDGLEALLIEELDKT